MKNVTNNVKLISLLYIGLFFYGIILIGGIHDK